MNTTDNAATTAWHEPARKLVQWRHCMSYNDSYFGEPAGLLKRITADFERLLPPNEQAAATAAQQQQQPTAWVNAAQFALLADGKREWIMAWGKPGKVSGEPDEQPVALVGIGPQGASHG